MIIKVQKYLGNDRWGKSFDYEIEEDKVIRVINEGRSSYQIVTKGSGRPKSIYYWIEEEEFPSGSARIDWREGQLFFDIKGEENSKLYNWAKSKGFMYMSYDKNNKDKCYLS
jgi:hypothetical protein